MNRDLKIWSVILGLLVMGIGITSVTHSFTGSGYRTVKAADEGAKTEGTAFSAAPSQEEALAESEQDCRARLAEYPDRLEELDAQIGRMRAVETDNTVQSVKSAVRTEQEIWERELDVVYSLLSELLDDEEKEKLRAGQESQAGFGEGKRRLHGKRGIQRFHRRVYQGQGVRAGGTVPGLRRDFPFFFLFLGNYRMLLWFASYSRLAGTNQNYLGDI